MKPFNLLSVFFIVILMGYFLGCASTGKQEGTGEYFDDSVITAKVKAEIFNDASLKSSEINVETFNLKTAVERGFFSCNMPQRQHKTTNTSC